MFSLGSLGYMVGIMVVDGPLRNCGGNSRDMLSGRADKPGEADPNPQSYDTDCSQSREWGHQGCLGHIEEGQKGHYQVQGSS